MIKIKYLFFLILLIGLAKPLTANAWCCRKIYWGYTLLTYVQHYGEVSNVSTEQQCLDTCVGSVSYCKNFYRKDATADVGNNVCVSPTTGCCQATQGESTPLATVYYWSYSANDQTECNVYCEGLVDCVSLFTVGKVPNTSTGRCEVAKVATDSGQSATDSGQAPSLNRSVYKTLPNPLGPTSWTIVDLPKVIGRVISAILTIIGAVALLIFVYGGFTWMTAAGNDAKVTQGKNILLWATIAIIIIFLSRLLVAFLFQALGV